MVLNQTDILGVKITSSKESEILEFLGLELDKAKSERRKILIFTPNPEQLSAASRNLSLKQLLNSSDINLPDGVGLVIAAKLLGKPIEARVAGVDFIEKVLARVAKRPVKSGFFGAQSGVAVEAANCLRKKHPKMSIGYASDVFDKGRMMQSDIDILFVALGFPKQEKWIMEHKDEVPASIIMAVGGSLDFISGRVPRAPKIFRDLGVEWIFRLIIQPWRFFRQLQLVDFGIKVILAIIKERIIDPQNKK